MTTIRFIGDIHGKWDGYKGIIKDVPISRQVGDFGVGFKYRDRDGEIKNSSNPPYDHIIKGDHKFIRGNHDCMHVCNQQSYWIKDGTIEIVDGWKIMYIGGALSIDKAWRTEGLDWWSDEELSIYAMNNIIDNYLIEKPDILVTHDCPEEIAVMMETWAGRKKLDIPSRTRQAFQSMFELFQPQLHIYGHWHFNIDKIYKGTRFMCLGELSYTDITLPEKK